MWSKLYFIFHLKKYFDEKNEMHILIWVFLLYLGEEFHAFYHFFFGKDNCQYLINTMML